MTSSNASIKCIYVDHPSQYIELKHETVISLWEAANLLPEGLHKEIQVQGLDFTIRRNKVMLGVALNHIALAASYAVVKGILDAQLKAGVKVKS